MTFLRNISTHCRLFYLQVIGDHDKEESDGSVSTEVGVFLYEQCSHNTQVYKKKDDEWWYIQKSEVIMTLKDPQEEKLSGKRMLFYFYDILNDI